MTTRNFRGKEVVLEGGGKEMSRRGIMVTKQISFMVTRILASFFNCHNLAEAGYCNKASYTTVQFFESKTLN